VIHLLLAGCTGGPPKGDASDWVLTDTGLKFNDIIVGDGREALSGDIVRVHYTGWLYIDGTRGKMFDSSEGREPIRFTIGSGEVIPGWEEGIEGMREGGERELLIPPVLAYGDQGAGAVIPPNATLIFTVRLIKIVNR
jgi:FKBP-type peptidyl-prolyl cis-trans isomerase FkpA